MIEVYTDGRAEPNPGLGTYGFVVYENGSRSYREKGKAGREVSNNFAEYFCLIKALEHLAGRRHEEIKVFSDSRLLVNQMRGEWKFKGGNYAGQYFRAKQLADDFAKLKFEWIPREKNSEADELTNLAFYEARGRLGPKG